MSAISPNPNGDGSTDSAMAWRAKHLVDNGLITLQANAEILNKKKVGNDNNFG